MTYTLLSDKFIFRAPIFSNTISSYDLIFNDPIFREGIFLASPDLYDLVFKDSISSLKQLNKKFQISILKYILRCMHRATPFGLFAGCGVGTISNGVENKVVIGCDKKLSQNYKCRVKLDTDFIYSLITVLKENDDLKTRTLYFPNNSGYVVVDNYRYVEVKYIDGRKKFFLSQIDYGEFLELVITQSKGKGAYLEDLAKTLEENEVTSEDANQYIHFLIDNQVLVSNIEPPLLNDDFLSDLAKKCSGLSLELGLINSIRELLKMVNNNNSDLNRIEIFRHIESLIKESAIPYLRKYLFQSDLSIFPKTATLNKSLADQIENCIPAISKLTTLVGSPLLEKFKLDFIERYEMEEVSLNEVFDSDIGIGFGNHTSINTSINPLVDDIGFVVTEGKSKIGEQSIVSIEVESFLLEKYHNSLKNSDKEIEIFDKELNMFSDNQSLPNTVATLVSIVDSDSETPLIQIDGATGLSAANFISRFWDTNQEIHRLANKIIRFEEACLNSNEVLAEVVHLPENRNGNVLNRPSLRCYEIPYVSRSSVDFDHTILLNDIFISVREDMIQLRSKTLDKLILPIVTSAHNYAKETLPIYHFLALLQVDYYKKFSFFSWPLSIMREPFLPRVMYKNVIISPAMWNIKKDDWRDLSDLTSSSLFERFKEFKIRLRLPEQFLVSEYDNTLFISCEDEMSIFLFVSEYTGKNILVKEYLYNPNRSVIMNEVGETYNNEIIFFWGKTQIDK
ncbi:MAG: lantibiotic dehydratase family protein [Agriterribacter sp.]